VSFIRDQDASFFAAGQSAWLLMHRQSHSPSFRASAQVGPNAKGFAVPNILA
jgi:hypothetical protein